jgi:hypothetical protein
MLKQFRGIGDNNNNEHALIISGQKLFISFRAQSGATSFNCAEKSHAVSTNLAVDQCEVTTHALSTLSHPANCRTKSHPYHTKAAALAVTAIM